MKISENVTPDGVTSDSLVDRVPECSFQDLNFKEMLMNVLLLWHVTLYSEADRRTRT